MHFLALYLLFLPPLLFGTPCDDADAPVVDYVTDEPSPCTIELPGKPPLDHQISPIPSLLLALE